MKQKQFTAAFLCASLLSTNCLFAHVHETSLWDERRKSIQLASVLPSVPKVLPSLSSSLSALPKLENVNAAGDAVKSLVESLPNTIGTVRKIRSPKGNPSRKIIVLIHDIHMNGEAQSNISAAIAALSKKGKLDFVALEGTSRNLLIESYRGDDKNSLETVANYLLRENKISGAVHAGLIVQGRPPVFSGVEDDALYRQNVQAYLTSRYQAPLLLKKVSSEEARLNAVRDQRLNPGLAAFDAFVLRYQNRGVDLGGYLAGLARYGRLSPALAKFFDAVKIEGSMDFDRVERERGRLLEKLTPRLSRLEIDEMVRKGIAYRLSALNANQFYSHLSRLAAGKGVRLSDTPSLERYIDYVRAADEIDGSALFDDMRRQEEEIYERLSNTAEERDLIARLKFVRSVKKLAAFSLTPDEWQQYKRLKFQISNSKYQANFKPKNPHSLSVEKRGFVWDLEIGSWGLSSFESFYEIARRRDAALSRGVIEKAGKKEAVAGVLIVGGFHGKAVETELNAAGFTVISFVPRLSTASVGDEAGYLSVFAQEKTPLERLVTGEKLFLARNPGFGLILIAPLRWIVRQAMKLLPERARVKMTRDVDTKQGTLRLSIELERHPQGMDKPATLTSVTEEAFESPNSIYLRAVDGVRKHMKGLQYKFPSVAIFAVFDENLRPIVLFGVLMIVVFGLVSFLSFGGIMFWRWWSAEPSSSPTPATPLTSKPLPGPKKNADGEQKKKDPGFDTVIPFTGPGAPAVVDELFSAPLFGDKKTEAAPGGFFEELAGSLAPYAESGPPQEDDVFSKIANLGEPLLPSSSLLDGVVLGGIQVIETAVGNETLPEVLTSLLGNHGISNLNEVLPPGVIVAVGKTLSILAVNATEMFSVRTDDERISPSEKKPEPVAAPKEQTPAPKKPSFWKKPRVSRPKAPRRLNIERLEGRDTPAGGLDPTSSFMEPSFGRKADFDSDQTVESVIAPPVSVKAPLAQTGEITWDQDFLSSVSDSLFQGPRLSLLGASATRTLAGVTFTLTGQADLVVGNQGYGEFGDAAYSPRTGTFWFTEQAAGRILEAQRNDDGSFTVLRDIDAGVLRQANEPTADIRGITYMYGQGNFDYMSVTQQIQGAPERLVVLRIAKGATAIDRVEGTAPLPDSPTGFFYSAFENSFYVVSDGPLDQRLFRISLVSAAGDFDASLAPILNPGERVVAVTKFERLTENQIIATNQRVMEVRLNTLLSLEVVSEFSLEGLNLPQPSGIAFSFDGRMFLLTRNAAGFIEKHLIEFTPDIPIPNPAPVAIAGPASIVRVSDTNGGTATATINGVGSHDVNGAVFIYRWFVNGEEVPMESNEGNPGVRDLTFPFPVGRNEWTLVVEGYDGKSATAGGVVLVKDLADNPPPTIIANVPSVVVADRPNRGTVTVTVDPRGVPPGETAAYFWTVDGVEHQVAGPPVNGLIQSTFDLLNLGEHNLTLRIEATDADGATQVAVQNFFVRLDPFSGVLSGVTYSQILADFPVEIRTVPAVQETPRGTRYATEGQKIYELNSNDAVIGAPIPTMSPTVPGNAVLTASGRTDRFEFTNPFTSVRTEVEFSYDNGRVQTRETLRKDNDVIIFREFITYKYVNGVLAGFTGFREINGVRIEIEGKIVPEHTTANQIVIEVTNSQTGEVLEWIVRKYNQQGDIEESFYRGIMVNGKKITPRQQFEGGFDPNERWTYGPIREGESARAVVKVEIFVFDSAGKTIEVLVFRIKYDNVTKKAPNYGDGGGNGGGGGKGSAAGGGNVGIGRRRGGGNGGGGRPATSLTPTQSGGSNTTPAEPGGGPYVEVEPYEVFAAPTELPADDATESKLEEETQTPSDPDVRNLRVDGSGYTPENKDPKTETPPAADPAWYFYIQLLAHIALMLVEPTFLIPVVVASLLYFAGWFYLLPLYRKNRRKNKSIANGTGGREPPSPSSAGVKNPRNRRWVFLSATLLSLALSIGIALFAAGAGAVQNGSEKPADGGNGALVVKNQNPLADGKAAQAPPALDATALRRSIEDLKREEIRLTDGTEKKKWVKVFREKSRELIERKKEELKREEAELAPLREDVRLRTAVNAANDEIEKLTAEQKTLDTARLKKAIASIEKKPFSLPDELTPAAKQNARAVKLLKAWGMDKRSDLIAIVRDAEWTGSVERWPYILTNNAKRKDVEKITTREILLAKSQADKNLLTEDQINFIKSMPPGTLLMLFQGRLHEVFVTVELSDNRGNLTDLRKQLARDEQRLLAIEKLLTGLRRQVEELTGAIRPGSSNAFIEDLLEKLREKIKAVQTLRLELAEAEATADEAVETAAERRLNRALSENRQSQANLQSRLDAGENNLPEAGQNKNQLAVPGLTSSSSWMPWALAGSLLLNVVLALALLRLWWKRPPPASAPTQPASTEPAPLKKDERQAGAAPQQKTSEKTVPETKPETADKNDLSLPMAVGGVVLGAVIILGGLAKPVLGAALDDYFPSGASIALTYVVNTLFVLVLIYFAHRLIRGMSHPLERIRLPRRSAGPQISAETKRENQATTETAKRSDDSGSARNKMTITGSAVFVNREEPHPVSGGEWVQLERVQYVLNGEQHQFRFRYYDDKESDLYGLLRRHTLTQLNVKEGTVAKRSFNYNYKNKKLTGFSERLPKTLSGRFYKRESLDRPTNLVITDQHGKVLAVALIQFIRKNRIRIFIFKSLPGETDAAAIEQRIAQGGKSDELVDFERPAGLEDMYRRIFNRAVDNIEAEDEGSYDANYKSVNDSTNHLVFTSQRPAKEAGRKAKEVEQTIYVVEKNVSGRPADARVVTIFHRRFTNGKKSSVAPSKLMAGLNGDNGGRRPPAADEKINYRSPKDPMNPIASLMESSVGWNFNDDGVAVGEPHERTYDIEETTIPLEEALRMEREDDRAVIRRDGASPLTFQELADFQFDGVWSVDDEGETSVTGNDDVSFSPRSQTFFAAQNAKNQIVEMAKKEEGRLLVIRRIPVGPLLKEGEDSVDIRGLSWMYGDAASDTFLLSQRTHKRLIVVRIPKDPSQKIVIEREIPLQVHPSAVFYLSMREWIYVVANEKSVDEEGQTALFRIKLRGQEEKGFLEKIDIDAELGKNEYLTGVGALSRLANNPILFTNRRVIEIRPRRQRPTVLFSELPTSALSLVDQKGMTFDSEGRLYLSTRGQWLVFNPDRPIPALPPVAKAGPDQIQVESQFEDGSAMATINAEGSFDYEGAIMEFEWYVNDELVGSKSAGRPNVGELTHRFPKGESEWTLVVTGYDGLQARAKGTVTVTESEGRPDVVMAPPPLGLATHLPDDAANGGESQHHAIGKTSGKKDPRKWGIPKTWWNFKGLLLLTMGFATGGLFSNAFASNSPPVLMSRRMDDPALYREPTVPAVGPRPPPSARVLMKPEDPRGLEEQFSGEALSAEGPSVVAPAGKTIVHVEPKRKELSRLKNFLLGSLLALCIWAWLAGYSVRSINFYSLLPTLPSKSDALKFASTLWSLKPAWISFNGAEIKKSFADRAVSAWTLLISIGYRIIKARFSRPKEQVIENSGPAPVLKNKPVQKTETRAEAGGIPAHEARLQRMRGILKTDNRYEGAREKWLEGLAGYGWVRLPDAGKKKYRPMKKEEAESEQGRKWMSEAPNDQVIFGEEGLQVWKKEEKEIQEIISMLRRFQVALKLNSLDPALFNEFLGGEDSLGLRSLVRPYGPALQKKDPKILLRAIARLHDTRDPLTTDRSFEFQDLLKGVLINQEKVQSLLAAGPSQEAAVTPWKNPVIPVTKKDFKAIASLLERASRSRSIKITLVMDYSTKPIYDKLIEKHRSRLQLIFHKEKLPLYAVAGGKRVINAHAFRQSLLRLPAEERAGYRVLIPIDASFHVPDDFDYKNNVFNEFEMGWLFDGLNWAPASKTNFNLIFVAAQLRRRQA